MSIPECRSANNELRAVTAVVSALGEPERAASAQNDKKSSLTFLAVRVPLLRAAVRDGFEFYSRSNAEILQVWSGIWFGSPHYEVMAMPLLYYQQGPVDGIDIFPVVKTWVERIENWGHSDSISIVFANLCLSDFGRVYPFLEGLVVSSERWCRRVAVVSLVLGLKPGAFSVPLDRAWPILDAVLSDDDPYVAKAVAWVLREAIRADHTLGLGYLEDRGSQLGTSVKTQVRREIGRAFPGINLTF